MVEIARDPNQNTGRRLMRNGKLAGVLATAALILPSPAAAHEKPSTEPFHSGEPVSHLTTPNGRPENPAVLRKARWLEWRIHHKQSVPFNAKKQIFWDSIVGSSLRKFLVTPPVAPMEVHMETDIPLQAKVGKHTRYFEIEQTGKKLSTLEVNPLPAKTSSLENPDFKGVTVQNPADVVHLSGGQPMIDIYFEGGGAASYPVAQSRQIG